MMFADPLSPTRRSILATSAAASALGLFPSDLVAATRAEPMRPFPVSFPEADLMDHRWRIAATRWPDQETVTDPTQGARLAKIRSLARYGGADYDWRKIEAKLNALPQFVTRIDGLDIHFFSTELRAAFRSLRQLG